MNTQQITPELRHWLLEQTRAGFGAQAVIQAMQDSGWDERTARSAWGEHAAGQEVSNPAAHTLLGEAAQFAQVPHLSAAPGLTSEGVLIWAHDRHVRVLMRMQHPCLALLADVLSAGECRVLREMAQERLARSETVATDNGGSEVNAARTSDGMFFMRGESELVARIEARLAALLGWPLDHGEGLQVLRYGPGAEYQPHFDYFDPTQPGSATVLRRGGQRLATLVMYLNTPEQGGETVFPDVGLSISPIEGQAVFFSYPHALPSSGTLHGGAPVVVGEKWVATKWFRQSRFD